MKTSAQQYISNEKNGHSYVTIYRNLFENREEKSAKDGNLYILLKMSSEQKAPLVRLSKFVIDSISDGYLYAHTKTTNEAMKNALEEGTNKLKTLMQTGKDIEDVEIKTTILVVLEKKEGFYIGSIGDGEIYVLKAGQAINISEIMKSKNANTAGIVLEENEALLVSTEGILSTHIPDIVSSTKEKKVYREITKIGVNLPLSSAILAFGTDEPIKPKEEIDNSKQENSKIVQSFIPKDEEEKEEARLELEQQEDISKRPKLYVKEVKRRSEEKNKISLILAKIKNFFVNAYTKVKPTEEIKQKIKEICEKIKAVLTKIGQKIREIFSILWEKITKQFAQKQWFKRIMARYSQMSLGRRPVRRVSTPVMRIDDYKVRDLRGKRFKQLFGILAVVLLIVLGVNFTIKTKKLNELGKDANEKFRKIENLLEKTESNLETDRTSAETTYFDATQIFKEIPEGIREKDEETKKKIEVRISEIGDRLFKKVGVSKEENNIFSYLDMVLNGSGEGSEPTDIEIYRDIHGKEGIFITDKGKKAVFFTPLGETPSIQIVSDTEKLFKSPMNVSVGVGGAFVYDKDAGVIKIPFNKDGGIENAISLPGLLGRDIQATDIKDMIILTENDNVYLLSADQKAILRSTAVYGDRYSMLSKYIENELFADARDILGDFSVYVTVEQEIGIVRYSWSYFEQKQIQTELGVTGPSGGLGKITKGYTFADSMDSGLYMFDAEGKRFFHFQKPQEGGADLRHPNQLLLIKQYEYRGDDNTVLNNVKDFVVDYNGENMYVLDGTTVWRIAL